MKTDINLAIANNIKEIRKNSELSLSDVSEKTGVSKSMLGQIERAESSPTISTLSKIAEGLNIPLDYLISHSEEKISVKKEAALTPVLSSQNHCRIFPLMPVRFDRNFECSDMILDPGACTETFIFPQGSTEFIFVYEGELSLDYSGEQELFIINESSFVSYPADAKHIYKNESERIARAIRIIQYK